MSSSCAFLARLCLFAMGCQDYQALPVVWPSQFVFQSLCSRGFAWLEFLRTPVIYCHVFAGLSFGWSTPSYILHCLTVTRTQIILCYLEISRGFSSADLNLPCSVARPRLRQRRLRVPCCSTEYWYTFSSSQQILLKGTAHAVAGQPSTLVCARWARSSLIWSLCDWSHVSSSFDSFDH